VAGHEKRDAVLESLMRRLLLLCLFMLVACATWGPRGSAREVALRGSALEFALSQIDAGGQAVVIADESVAEVRRLLPHRRVMARSQFVKDHPVDGPMPPNISVEVPRFEGDTVHVQMHVPGVIPPVPPGVLWCGQGLDFILVRDGKGWRIVKRWETLC